jgi:hypothetical protein
MTYRMAACAAVLMILSFAPRTWADDFTDQIDKARTAYGKHDLREAQRLLDTAENLLRQQRLVQWKTVLPDALDGWKADNIEGNAAAMAMLGGGVSVSRRYHRGGTLVTIEVVAESPIVASVAGIVGMLTAAGAETQTIDGQTVIYRKDNHSLMNIVDGLAMFTVKGQSATEDDLHAYYKAVHRDKIETLLK